MRQRLAIVAASAMFCAAMGQSAADQPEAFVTIEGGSVGEAAPKDIDLAPFVVQRDEVTRQQYEACVDAGGCSAASALDEAGLLRTQQLEAAGLNAADQPVIGVTGPQAAQYCEWMGARLPTMLEYDYLLRSVISPGPSEYSEMMSAGRNDEICAAFDLPAYDANVVPVQGATEPLVLCAERATARPDGPRYVLGSAAEWAHNTLAEGLPEGFAKQLPRGGSWRQGVADARVDDDRRAHLDVGIRCAKGIE